MVHRHLGIVSKNGDIVPGFEMKVDQILKVASEFEEIVTELLNLLLAVVAQKNATRSVFLRELFKR